MQELIGAVGQLSPKERKALAIMLKQKGIDLFSIAPVFRRDPSEPVRLSYAQERQWFLWQLEPDSTAYHVPSALRLRGALDVAALQRSFDALFARHETLRTTFESSEQGPLQVIHDALGLPIVVEDFTAGPVDTLPVRLQLRAQALTQELFDLQAGPLLRARLLKVAEDDHVLVLTQHHIVSDGWSMQVMVDELVQGYAAFSQGLALQLPVLPVQYADYAAWQRQWMEAGERERQLAYWTERLGGSQPVLELPLDRPRPQEPSLRGGREAITLSAELVAGLRRLAREEGVTLFTLLLASFQALLHRYSGQDDIRVGVPVANRGRAEIQRLIGFFVNTQVLKAEVDSGMSFRALLQQLKEAVQQAQSHQDLPFEQLVDALQLERNLGQTPLFQVMFNHQSEDQERATGQLSGLSVEPLVLPRTTAQFDLTLDTHESAEGLSASLSYACDLFEAATIVAMGEHWRTLLQGIVADPAKRIGELSIQSPAAIAQALAQWNPAPGHWAVDECLHQRIAAQAARAPEAVALSCDGQQLSYAEFECQANRLAHRLIALGVAPEVRVGLACERGVPMLVAILAILKAGGAYVPLDPQYPDERLAFMIEDSGITLLLTDPQFMGRLPVPQSVAVLSLADSTLDCPQRAPQVDVSPDNLAYIIYTSGSTGKPKGTLLPHRNVLRLFSATEHWFGFTHDDVWTLFHSYAFDFSVWEIFGALLYGGRLVMVSHETSRSPQDFLALLVEQQVTVLNQTPSAFRQLMQVACDQDQPQPALALRHVVFGGEALEVKALRPWFERFGDRAPRLVNMYGITETTVHVTYRPLSLADLDLATSSPIGEPIADLSWYLLDADLNPVPKGCIGELFVGRAGLARGYLNRADLSATRFVPDPFGEPGARLYRTGDLARYCQDGVIEYIGRIDHQVKIRGFRIELGEIEARLQACDGVRQAVVLAQPSASGQQLVGYVVAQDPSLDVASLREALRRDLPDYMVPAHLLLIEQLPLTGNGKLDRKALPQPDVSQAQRVYVAPASELEQRIAAIWQDVLRLERVGLADNFFELGGDSIISIQVVSRARQAGIHFTPKQLFQHQTVQGLASVARVGGEASEAGRKPASGGSKLLPVQQRFFEAAIDEPWHWNQSVLLKPRQRLEVDALQQALQALLSHHDALRLRFERGAQGWEASFQPFGSVMGVLWQEQLSDAGGLLALGERAQRSLDLGGCLLRAVLVELGGGEQRLLLVIHHLVVDGVSWRVLFEDLQTAYEQVLAGQVPVLPARTSSVQDWAARLGTHARSQALRAQLPYWQAQQAQASAALPLDRPLGGLVQQAARTVHCQLDRETTRRLLQDAPAAYRTQVNDLLLTALARVLSCWTGADSVSVQLEGHGREELFEDIDLTRTVGWFTSVYPVRLIPAHGLGESVKAIKEQLRGVPDKGMGFGVLRYLGDPETRAALAAMPQPQVTFNYLGQFDGSFDDQAALLRPTAEPRGLEKSPLAALEEVLAINGQVYGGALSLGWTFSAEQFDSATIQRVADAFIVELCALVEHCCDPSVRGITPSDFPLAQLDQAELDALPLAPEQLEDLYPLAPMQQGMLFHTLYEQQAGDYINQMRIEVDGLDPERFRLAWMATLAAHPVLRTGFLWQGPLQVPLQWVSKAAVLPFVEHDWRGRHDLPQALDDMALSQREQGFDLSRPPLLRLVLVRTSEHGYHLIYTNHHVLMDGWSNSRLLGEVLHRYSGQHTGMQPALYRNYIEWLQVQDPALSEAFWKDQTRALEQPTLLARACSLGNQAGHGQVDYRHALDLAATRQLTDLAKRAKVTVNTVLQAAWLMLLQRYTGQSTVCFGATVSGRPAELKGVEEQIGLFINTLPVVATPQPHQSLNSWLQALQVQNLALREQEHTPLFEIQRWAGQAGEALFDNILVFENYPVAEALQQASPQGLRFGEISNREQTNYPLTLAVALGEQLALHYSYDSACFDSATIAQIDRHLTGLLARMCVVAETASLSEITLYDRAEQARTLAEWNPASQTWPVQGSLHGCIAAQAARVPEAIALTFRGQHVTYGELESRANRLAHRLVASGVHPEVRVGLACERGPDMLVGLLAILKAGGAYVPLDPQYPQDRLAYMIEDSGIGLLLAEPDLLAALPVPAGLAVVRLNESFEGYPEQPPQVQVTADNLAYVIYTSGSTGKPKGALLAHANVLRLFSATEHWFGFAARDVWTLFHSYAFDFSVWEIFGALLYGGRLVIVPHETTRSPESFLQLLVDERVTVLNQTPSAFRQLMQVACTPTRATPDLALRHVVFGGEALDVKALRPWFETFGDEAPRLVNMYGITETTVHVTYRPLSLADLELAVSSPIGEPIADLSWYLLDADLNPVPKGCIGELYVGRAGLARGYLNRAELTATRFVPDPFGGDGGRLYRTGDLARYGRDGVVEYVGRIDHQVKIRGFRIELGEIEARLQACEGVREAVVLAQPGPSGQQLVGYVVAREAGLDLGGLRQLLKRDLPDYMVPSHLLLIEQLPLTSNGKLDRKALPQPDASQLQQTYLAPVSELQQQLAAIWQDVLRLERVGLGDNFFELGGHSLLVVNVVSRIQLELGLQPTPQQLFQFPTLGAFAEQLADTGEQLNTSKLNKLESLLDEMEEV